MVLNRNTQTELVIRDLLGSSVSLNVDSTMKYMVSKIGWRFQAINLKKKLIVFSL